MDIERIDDIEWLPEDFRRLMGLALEIADCPTARLAEYRDEIMDFVRRIEGRRDEMRDEPWTRCPARFFTTHWRTLRTHEQKVFGALLGLVDFKTLTTYAGLERIAKRAGLSPSRTSKALTGLKKKGHIKRWRQQYKQWRPYFTKIIPQACFPNEKAAEVLKQAVVN